MPEQLTCDEVFSLITEDFKSVLSSLFKDYFKILKEKYPDEYKEYWTALMIAPLCEPGTTDIPFGDNGIVINGLRQNIDDIDRAINGINDISTYCTCVERSYLISRELDLKSHKKPIEVPTEITFQSIYDLEFQDCLQIYLDSRSIRNIRNLVVHHTSKDTAIDIKEITTIQKEGVWYINTTSTGELLKILNRFCRNLSISKDVAANATISEISKKLEEIENKINGKMQLKCEICGKVINDSENTISRNKFGKSLCPDCMNKNTSVDDESKKIDECSILENTSDNTIKNIEIKKAEPDEKPINTLVPISQVTPQLIIFLVDMSESMGRVYSVNPNKTKAEVVTEVLNTGLYDLFASGLRGQGYKNYFYVCVKGYYGSNNGPKIIDLFACNKDTPPDIKKSNIRPIIQYQEHAANKKDWLIFTPGGTTPMLAAFNYANKIIGEWEKDVDAYVKKMIPGTSIPADRVYPAPIIISISDGHYTNDEGDVKDMSASPVDVIEEIQQISSKKFANKPPLVFNFLISGVSDNENDALIFPAEIPENSDFYLEELFSFSSSLPPEMIRNGFVNDEKIKKNAKGLMYKASVSNLIDLLKIGTRVTCLSASNNTKHPIDKGV